MKIGEWQVDGKGHEMEIRKIFKSNFMRTYFMDLKISFELN